MSQPPHIRPAVEGDQPQLFELLKELDDLHLQARPDIFKAPVGPRRNPALIPSLIAGPDSTILVAEDKDRRLLGTIILFAKTMPPSAVRDERRIVEIDNLVVRTEARRCGVARLLLDATAEWGKTRGASVMELTVWAFNDGAHALYKTAGFETATLRMARPL